MPRVVKSKTTESNEPETSVPVVPQTFPVEKVVKVKKSKVIKTETVEETVTPVTKSSSVSVAVNTTVPLVQEAVAEETLDASDIAVQSAEFLSKLTLLGSQIASLKAEYKAIDKKWARELKAALKLSSKRKRKSGNRAPSGFVKPTRISDELATFLEKTIDKMSVDLKSLMSNANQTTTSLSSYRDQIQEIDRKLGEVGKLRSTLSQMSKTYSAPEPVTENTYLVKSGDTLEKIARKYQTTADALKKSNQLSSDKIVIGQELTISR